MKKLVLMLMLFAAFMAPRPALCATVIDRVMAVVGPDVVTLSELQSEMAPAMSELNRKYRGEELASAVEKLKSTMLNNLIDKHLQLQEAKLQGIEVSSDEVDNAVNDIIKKNNMDMAAFKAALDNEGYTIDDYRKNISDQLTMLRLVNRAVKSKVTIKEEEVRDYYERHKNEFSSAETVRVANISFPAPKGDKEQALANANKARAEIMAGASFEEMAAKCTGDPNAAKTCVLGTFGKGEMAEAIEKKAFAMQAGEVSEPIPSGDGYQLIKVMEKGAGSQKSYEDVKGQIVEMLSSQKAESIFAAWIQSIRNRTYVEIRD